MTFPVVKFQRCNYNVVFFCSGGKGILQRCNYDDLLKNVLCRYPALTRYSPPTTLGEGSTGWRRRR